MKILKSWLKQYIEPVGEMSDDALAELFRRAGIEVESIESGIDENVIVAEILSVSKHPDADRLSLADVSDNSTTYKIVCGAPNIKKGQKVPLAKIGAVLPGDFKIKKSKIRGVESEGMLCALDELGLGTDHSGIIILPDEYEVGEPLNKYLNKETVFNISITPNRGDWLSHVGVARELGAFLGQSFKKEPIELGKTGQDIRNVLSLEVIDESNCPQYFARVINNVKIGPSPEWLKKKLEACGVRSINNVVDVTNYILLDSGHPLHAFDHKKIIGKKIVVRPAKDGESITTLDGVERKLNQDNLVIADQKNSIAIAGVMGGLDSEVSNDSVDIVLEAALFNPASIRKTSKTLKLQSEASYRFERGVDYGDSEYVINKAAQMITELAGGTIATGILKFGETAPKKAVEIDYQKINNLLGLELSIEVIRHNLKSLGIELKGDTAIVPHWRHDISILEDLTEEVGRIKGYDIITPIYFEKETPPPYSNYYYEELIKDILVKAGFSETINYPYLSEKDIEALNLDKDNLLEVVNPLQEEYKYLRISLLPGLIKAVAKNPAFDPTLLFEVSHVYFKNKELTNLAIVASGKDAKARIDQAVLNIAGSINPKVNELSREELIGFKVKKPVVYTFEINILDLIKASEFTDDKLKLKIEKKEIVYRPISRFPMMTRDLAFIVDKLLSPEEIVKEIYSAGNVINRVELFDEFVSDKFGKNKKNIAFHLYLQEMDRTLTDLEADQLIKKIVKIIENKYQAELRKA